MSSCIVFVLFGGLTFASSGCHHSIHHSDDMIVPHSVVYTSHLPRHRRVHRVHPSRVFWRHQGVRYQERHHIHRRHHSRVRYHNHVRPTRRHHQPKLRKRVITRHYNKKGQLRKRVIRRHYGNKRNIY